MNRKPRLSPPARIPLGYLLASLGLAVASLALVGGVGERRPYEKSDVALAAARRMAAAGEAVRGEMLRRCIALEAADDPNATYYVGPEWTALTTTLGDVEAKRTTANPNFAAAMVRYLEAAGCRRGDAVAIGASGSFPALLVATLCAAEELGLRALVISSFGASMYGATRPEFPITSFMRVLAEAGLASPALLAVSPGGDGDAGGNALFEDSGSVIDGLARDSGVAYLRLSPPSVPESIAARLRLYDEAAGPDGVACFVNIGGASPNSGTSAYTLDFPQGLVIDPPRIPATPDRGLVYEYAARGVPVINLLNVRRLAMESGLPFDPVPLPGPGEGDVYFERRTNAGASIVALICALAPLALGFIHTKRSIPTPEASHG